MASLSSICHHLSLSVTLRRTRFTEDWQQMAHIRSKDWFGGRSKGAEVFPKYGEEQSELEANDPSLRNLKTSRNYGK